MLYTPSYLFIYCKSGDSSFLFWLYYNYNTAQRPETEGNDLSDQPQNMENMFFTLFFVQIINDTQWIILNLYFLPSDRADLALNSNKQTSF